MDVTWDPAKERASLGPAYSRAWLTPERRQWYQQMTNEIRRREGPNDGHDTAALDSIALHQVENPLLQRLEKQLALFGTLNRDDLDGPLESTSRCLQLRLPVTALDDTVENRACLPIWTAFFAKGNGPASIVLGEWVDVGIAKTTRGTHVADAMAEAMTKSPFIRHVSLFDHAWLGPDGIYALLCQMKLLESVSFHNVFPSYWYRPMQGNSSKGIYATVRNAVKQGLRDNKSLRRISIFDNQDPCEIDTVKTRKTASQQDFGRCGSTPASTMVELILHALKHHPALEELHVKVSQLPQKPDHRAMARLLTKLPNLERASFEMISSDMDTAWASYRASMTSVVHQLGGCHRLQHLSVSHASKLGNSFVSLLLKALRSSDCSNQAPSVHEQSASDATEKEGPDLLDDSVRDCAGSSSVSSLCLSHLSLYQWTTICNQMSKNHSKVLHLRGSLHESWRSSGGDTGSKHSATTARISDLISDNDSSSVSIAESHGWDDRLEKNSNNYYDGALALRNLLTLNSVLATLHIANQKLTNYGVLLAKGLSSNSHLSEMILTKCDLALTDVCSLSDALSDTNRSITSLGLNLTCSSGGNRFTDEQDVRYFLMAVANQGNIAKLRLEGTVGMGTVAQALRTNQLPTLVDLQMDYQSPCSPELAELVKALESNTSLEILTLPETSIDVLEELSLPRNNRLRQL
jgi:hypothetical protein